MPADMDLGPVDNMSLEDLIALQRRVNYAIAEYAMRGAQQVKPTPDRHSSEPARYNVSPLTAPSNATERTLPQRRSAF